MSMAQGFAQGFGMMNNFMQQQYEKERQAAADAENNRRYEEGVARQDRQWQHSLEREQRQDAITDENRMIDYAAKGLTPDMTPEQKQGVMMNQRAIALQQAEEDRQWGRKKDELSMQRDRSAMALDAIKRDAALTQLDNEKVQAGLQAAMIGDDETARKYLPQTLTSAWAKRADAANTYANQYSELDSAYKQASTPEEKQQILDAMNQHIMADTPEARALFNSANYQSYAERIKANPDIESISHAGFMPAGGGYVPMMEIKYKGKDKAEVVPATKFRTSRADDEIVVLPPSVIKQRAAEGLTLMGSAKRMMEENPAMAQKLGFREKPVYVGYGAKLVDPMTGQVIADNERTSDSSKQALQEADYERKRVMNALQIKRVELGSTTNTDERKRLFDEINALEAMLPPLNASTVQKIDSTTNQSVNASNMKSTTGGFNKDLIMQRLQMQTPKQ
jgi:hypothetical protein